MKWEYDNNGDKLSKEKVHTSNLGSMDDIIGFISKTGAIVKYRKSTRELVLYRASPTAAFTISYL